MNSQENIIWQRMSLCKFIMVVSVEKILGTGVGGGVQRQKISTGVQVREGTQQGESGGAIGVESIF